MAFVDALFDGTAELAGVLAKRARSCDNLRRMVLCRRAIPLVDGDLPEVLSTIEPQALSQAERWINNRRIAWEQRLDRLGEYLKSLQKEGDDDGAGE